MPGEYPVVRVGDVCYVTDGAHAKVDRQPQGVLYLTSKNIGVGQLLLGEVDYIGEEDYERLFANSSKSQRRLSPGDVLVGIIGTFGNAYLYKNQDHFGMSSAVALLRPDQSRLEPRFLYYVVTSPIFRGAHSAYKAGSVQGYTNIPTIKELPVPIPPLPEQRAIAHILGTLDDKIELNRRLNETLEAIARALFKSWFVDFDPVRAKAEGPDAGLPPHLAALFPDRFEDSELGEIPAVWDVGSVYQVAEVIYGAPFRSALFNEEGIGLPLIRIRDLDTHEPKVFTPEEHPKGYRVQPGDLVVGMDGEFRAHLWHGRESWLNQRVCCFRAKSDNPRSFVHYSIDEPLRFFEESKTGTTVIHLGKADIDTFRIVVPPKPVLAAFGQVVSPIDSRLVCGAAESRTLAALRDALLSKLISGELRVKDAERLAEAHT